MARKWWTLLVVCLAIFMLLLDVTIVNVALADIERDLGASFSQLQWVVNAYALTLAALLLMAGSLGDLLGRRRVFAAGLGVFTAASLICGLSPSATFLDLARGLQGIGAAAMFAVSLALIAQEFHGRERGTAFGIWGATTGLAVAIGPLVGGVLTESLGWQWIFLVNVPIGLATLAVVFARVAESRAGSGGRIDWPGVVTFSAALFALIFGLIRTNEDGWGSPLVVGLLVGAGALLALFVAVESHSERPMLDLGLFAKPAFAGASIVGLLLMGGLTVDSDWTALVIGMLVAGAGMGVMNPPLASVAVAVVEPAKSGMASGINGTFRQVGIATGIAGLGAIFQARVAERAGELLAGTPGLSAGGADRLAGAIAAGGGGEAIRAAPPGTREAAGAAARAAYVAGLNEILLVAAIVAFVGAALGLALVRARDVVQDPAAAA